MTHAISIRFFSKDDLAKVKKGVDKFEEQYPYGKVIDMSDSRNLYKKRVGAYFNFLNNN